MAGASILMRPRSLRRFSATIGACLNRGRRLGVGGAHRIAETVDVGIALVAQRLLINLDPAGMASEWARSDEVGRALGRNDVQHVELAFDDLAVPVLPGPLEPCRL